jgi:hypothetical protein
MHARVGATGPQMPRLMQRLRALTPAWSVTRREARWVAEQQAKLLLAEAHITAPPIPERIVTDLDGVRVHPLAQVPVKGLMGVSKPSSRGGDILIDSTLPLTERRITLLHELKHIIDGGHTTRPRQAGNHSSSEGALHRLRPQRANARAVAACRLASGTPQRRRSGGSLLSARRSGRTSSARPRTRETQATTPWPLVLPVAAAHR